jgi:hypothetical protein
VRGKVKSDLKGQGARISSEFISEYDTVAGTFGRTETLLSSERLCSMEIIKHEAVGSLDIQKNKTLYLPLLVWYVADKETDYQVTERKSLLLVSKFLCSSVLHSFLQKGKIRHSLTCSVETNEHSL